MLRPFVSGYSIYTMISSHFLLPTSHLGCEAITRSIANCLLWITHEYAAAAVFRNFLITPLEARVL